MSAEAQTLMLCNRIRRRRWPRLYRPRTPHLKLGRGASMRWRHWRLLQTKSSLLLRRSGKSWEPWLTTIGACESYNDNGRWMNGTAKRSRFAFQPIHRLAHLENYLFLSSLIIGSHDWWWSAHARATVSAGDGWTGPQNAAYSCFSQFIGQLTPNTV